MQEQEEGSLPSIIQVASDVDQKEETIKSIETPFVKQEELSNKRITAPDKKNGHLSMKNLRYYLRTKTYSWQWIKRHNLRL